MAQQNGSASEASGSRRARGALGALETRLMEALWGSDSELSVQGVSDALGPGHNYKTVMTVLNRLVEKGLLMRELDGRAYRYRPSQSRPQFLRSAADELVRGYLDAYGPEAAAHLASAAGAAPAPQSPPASAPPQPDASMAFGGWEAVQRSPLRLLLIAAAVLFLLTRSRRGRS
ncbi:MAG: BlaI/MecI/CopY family transcriptional regulator [Chloroflexi bacterium]|nr:BlaI/MecI/CopY family transcriptional regulator [Chloroflexota bacterium]MCI0778966.1 BlaI/MecI/CopY family transcriptional regulator [Chloroflexota bacterium]MCI0888511.1 BlaI/MecI/CopY family transcriptional regulator [Chloroflexota bacterium]